jgi:hypothetical protein
MSKEMTIIVLGVWVIVVPYLGFPTSWKTVIFFVTGVLVVYLGFSLRAGALARGSRRTEHHPFAENHYSHGQKEGINSFN